MQLWYDDWFVTGVQVLSPCMSHLDTQTLERLATGEEVSEEALAHLAECEQCRRGVDEVAANNRFLSNFIAKVKTAQNSGGLSEEEAQAQVQEKVRRSRMLALPTIPGYVVSGEIHRGGQGVVFKAMQLATKREVAIKLPLAGSFVSEKAKIRFEREIELIAQMNHPNIVTVHDSGITPDGRYYIVMELIDGVPLDKFISVGIDASTQTGRRRSEFILKLFAKIAGAVQHAHARGVIHRDLKPGNILVDSAGEPHVLDFGLARRGEWSPETSPTLVDEFQGTPAYASPEQVSGDPRGIDVRTDVYSLGIMLYRTLTGQWPYSVEGSLSDQIKNIKFTLPMAPSRRVRGITPEIDTIVLTALAKEPPRRYQSAGELETDLLAYLQDQPLKARRASVWYVLTKAIQRRKMMAVGVTALVVCAGVALGALLYANQARELAAMELAQGQAAAEKAAADLTRTVMRKMVDAGAGGNGSGGNGGQRLYAKTTLDATAKELDDGLGLQAGSLADRRIHIALRKQLGALYGQMSFDDASLHQYQIASAMLDVLPGATSEELLQVRAEVSTVLERLGRHAEAIDAAKRALDDLKASSTPDAEKITQASERLVRAHLAAGQTFEAAQVVEQQKGKAQGAAKARLLILASQADLARFEGGGSAERDVAREAAIARAREAIDSLQGAQGDSEAIKGAERDAQLALARAYNAGGEILPAEQAAVKGVTLGAGVNPLWQREAIASVIWDAGKTTDQQDKLSKHIDDVCALMQGAANELESAANAPLTFVEQLTKVAHSATLMGDASRGVKIAQAGRTILSQYPNKSEAQYIKVRLELLRIEKSSAAKSGDPKTAALRQAERIELMELPNTWNQDTIPPMLTEYTELVSLFESLGEDDQAIKASRTMCDLAAKLHSEPLTGLMHLTSHGRLLSRLQRFREAYEVFQHIEWLCVRLQGKNPQASAIRGDGMMLASGIRREQGDAISALMWATAGELLTQEKARSNPLYGYTTKLKVAQALAAIGNTSEANAMIIENVDNILEALPPGTTWGQQALEIGIMHAESTGNRDLAAKYWELLRGR